MGEHDQGIEPLRRQDAAELVITPMDAYNFIRYRRVALTANETIEVKRPGFVKSNVGAERAGK